MKRLAHYSQYFLRSPRLINELIGHTSIKKSDTVYDIGAGSGAITAALAKRAQKVVAVEVEPRMAAKLRANTAHYKNVAVIEQDVMSLPLPRTPYKVFANIPFHLSSPIIQKLTIDANPPLATYLIVQRQLARKLLPEHSGFTSQLGIIIGAQFAVRIRRNLRRTDFWPHPNVDTVLLEIKPRPEPLLPTRTLSAFKQLVQTAFEDPKFFASIALTADLPLGVKPSRLVLLQWIEIARKKLQS